MTTVERIKAWAKEHYETSYGASCIVECFDDAEIAQMFSSLADAQEYAEIQDERMAGVSAEAGEW